MSKLTQAEAEKKLTAAGITWSSSGNCTDRDDKTCTSFEQINSQTIDGIIAFKRACGGTINITGGTETGHSTSTHSHKNGYKVDITPNLVVDNYIKKHFEYLGLRGDGAKNYKSKAGNLYARESNHWDITYF
jgi:hypothetical protein